MKILDLIFGKSTPIKEIINKTCKYCGWLYDPSADTTCDAYQIHLLKKRITKLEKKLGEF